MGEYEAMVFRTMQGASGVGLAAIQLCKRLYKDTKVIVTVGTCALCLTVRPMLCGPVANGVQWLCRLKWKI